MMIPLGMNLSKMELLEYPQYTRPPVFLDKEVPEVLLSGHHENIRKWRHEQSVKRTKERRPDLWEAYEKEMKEKMGKIGLSLSQRIWMEHC